MQLTAAALLLFFQNANLTLQTAWRAQTPPVNTAFATTQPSSTEQEVYGASTRTGLPREWIGERQARNVGTVALTVINRHFESTIEISADKLADDQFGLFNYAIADLARAANIFPDVLALFNVFINGNVNAPTYDGQNFFSTAHPIDLYTGQSQISATAGNSQVNYFNNFPLTFDNYQFVRSSMMKYRGDDGLPFGVMPDTLICGPELEITARLICEAGSVAPVTLGANSGSNAAGGTGITQVGANDNMMKGTANVVVWPLLGIYAPYSWFVLDTKSRGIKPVILQERKAPQTIPLTDPSYENVFKRNMFEYGVDFRLNMFGYAWFTMVKCVPGAS